MTHIAGRLIGGSWNCKYVFASHSYVCILSIIVIVEWVLIKHMFHGSLYDHCLYNHAVLQPRFWAVVS